MAVFIWVIWLFCPRGWCETPFTCLFGFYLTFCWIHALPPLKELTHWRDTCRLMFLCAVPHVLVLHVSYFSILRFLQWRNFSIVNLCFISPLNMLIFSKQWYYLFTFNCMFYNKKGNYLWKWLVILKKINNLVFGSCLCVCTCLCVFSVTGLRFSISLISLESRTLICPHLLGDTQRGLHQPSNYSCVMCCVSQRRALLSEFAPMFMGLGTCEDVSL